MNGRAITTSDSDAETRDFLPPGEATLQRLRALRMSASTMRKVRWFGAAFIAVQFTLYTPPPGIDLPFDRLTAGLAVLAAVVLVNLGSLAARRVTSPTTLARIGAAELVIDAAVVLSVTWMFSFDTTSALWALLVIPVLEGAVRGQLRGALLTWGGVAVGYLLRDLWAASRYDYAPFLVESVTYRMFIVFIVALSAGLLARNLTRTAGDLAVQVHAHRMAQTESERRADLLQTVAGAGRYMTTLDLDQLLAIVVDSVTEIGFDGALIAVLAEDGQTYAIPHSSGVPPHDPDERVPLRRGIVQLALQRRETVTLTEPLARYDPSLQLPFARTLATPVWSGEDLVAVLVAGVEQHLPISVHTRECFELLAAQAGAAVVNARRYSDRRAFQAQLEYQAFHDALTGLANRAFFLDRLDKALAPLGPEEAGDGLVGVLFLDLDRFKQVNDTLGHDVGDKLLIEVATRVRACVRGNDVLARLGGDEFTVLLGSLSDEEDAARVARRILKAMEAPIDVGGTRVHATTSIGVAYGFRGRHQPRDILRAADLAMYEAKENGRDRFAVSPLSWDSDLADLHAPPEEIIL